MSKVCLILLFLSCNLITACHRTTVQRSTTSTEQAPATAPASTPGPQPTEAELRAAVQRNYEDAVSIDRSKPYVIGDFNGDQSEDIAIVVKPVKEKLSAINSEFANWIVEDPHLVEARQTTNRVTNDEALLAVIHGHEREGWRNAMARQTYLLKNAVGEDFERRSPQQMSTGSKSLPVLKGDVIREKLDGTNGIIFWTGAKYAWRPVS